LIAIDTSALMAIVLDEPQRLACMARINVETEVLISAATLVEALIVAARRNVWDQMVQLIDGLGLDVAPVTGAAARRIADAHRRWGRGSHPARLNFGDCFAYDVAKEHHCPLLFVGDDFARTDVTAAC
jgi:ribonuclease VapC